MSDCSFTAGGNKLGREQGAELKESHLENQEVKLLQILFQLFSNQQSVK